MFKLCRIYSLLILKYLLVIFFMFGCNFNTKGIELNNIKYLFNKSIDVKPFIISMELVNHYSTPVCLHVFMPFNELVLNRIDYINDGYNQYDIFNVSDRNYELLCIQPNKHDTVSILLDMNSVFDLYKFSMFLYDENDKVIVDTSLVIDGPKVIDVVGKYFWLPN